MAARAARQHGVISIKQLREAGLSEDAVRGRVGAGRLHRIHRGVYAVGHRGLSVEGGWMAAALAHGDDAVLSHRSAASLWRLLDVVASPVDISIPTTSGRRPRPGIRLHRRRPFAPGSVTRRNRIPVTTPAQTISDLRRAVPPAQMRRAIRQAEVLGLQTGPKRREPTRSELEHLFLRLCERYRLPRPEVNVRVGTYEVDFLWRAERLVVETDGYKYHRGRQAFEDDHDRSFALRDAGLDVLRLTHKQVVREPDRVAGLVARELGRTRAAAPPHLPASRA